VKSDRDLIKWHQRYGHLIVSDLKSIKNNDIVLGMKFASQTNEINCETCTKCKIHCKAIVKPFKPSMTHEKEILSLIYSDICGPINVESVSGARYFIGDYSRYTEVVMLCNKCDAVQVFKTYKRKVENLTGKYIKKLRKDNKEYISKQFSNFLQEKNIMHQLSAEPSTK